MKVNDSPMAQRTAVLAYVLVVVVVWAVLPALLQTVPHADNVEQLNWSHSLEWGYIKHPPLPTWLLRSALAVFPASALLTYGLAMACAGASLLLLWRCARQILDARSALLVLLFSSLDYYLMGRGSFLNHNTVMLPFVASSAWCVLRILQGANGSLWLLLGLVQALGLLTKYQMGVIILANALCLLALGTWRQPHFVRNACIGILATVLPLLPHALWLQQHDFSTFSYAGHSLLASLPLLERVQHTLGFSVQQLGRLAPAILALALALAWERRAPRNPAAADAPATPDRASLRALAILALVPPATVLALCLFAGVAPQNHWGASTTLLLPFLAIAVLPSARRPAVLVALWAAIVLQALAVSWNVVAAQRNPGFHHSFAARALADMALAKWQHSTGGELAIVIGPDWEAGSISLELPSHPAVLGSGDRRQAPWIDDARIRQCGALLFWRPGEPIASQLGSEFAARMQAPEIMHASGPQGTISALGMAILAPQANGCTASSAAQ